MLDEARCDIDEIFVDVHRTQASRSFTTRPGIVALSQAAMDFPATDHAAFAKGHIIPMRSSMVEASSGSRVGSEPSAKRRTGH